MAQRNKRSNKTHTPLKNTEIACMLYNTFPNMHNATRHKMD